MTEDDGFDEFFDIVGEDFVEGRSLEFTIIREPVVAKTRKVYSINVGGGTGVLRSYNDG
jgi:hypothetical protein